MVFFGGGGMGRTCACVDVFMVRATHHQARQGNTVDHLRYLTIEQALADTAVFLANKAEVGLARCTVCFACELSSLNGGNSCDVNESNPRFARVQRQGSRSDVDGRAFLKTNCVERHHFVTTLIALHCLRLWYCTARDARE